MRIFVGSKKQINLNLKDLVSKPNSKKFKYTKWKHKTWYPNYQNTTRSNKTPRSIIYQEYWKYKK